MTTLKQVAKEDLEEGRGYIYESLILGLFGVVNNGCFMTGEDVFRIESMPGKFYGPIELEGE